MKYGALVLFIFALLFCSFPTRTFAKYNPKVTPNNKYGIHIVELNDISEVSDLINTSGGDWGYVTLVIQESDQNTHKWQSIFDAMRRKHLIPLVRLATTINGSSWRKPNRESIASWTTFLNSLNWPIENRYVILFNEPNHANEWGGEINPQEYAMLATEFTKELHEASEDFFVLPAGFDVSAATDNKSLDAAAYIKMMHQSSKELFDLLDGWTSHSYPNPGFSGSAFASGRGTVRSYAWEQEFLHSLGVTKNYPIFITETGWVHAFGVTNNINLLSPESVGFALKQAANVAWTDPAIIAITPFIFNYQGLPFDHFSWKKLGSNDYYPHYYAYKDIPKTKGLPYQRESYTLDRPFIPDTLVSNSSVNLISTLSNAGQSIISSEDGYSLHFSGPKSFILTHEALPTIDPNTSSPVQIHLQVPNVLDKYPYTISLTHADRTVTLETGEVTLIPPPSVKLHIQLGFRRTSDINNATVLIYDDNNELIHKIQGVPIQNGVAVVSNLTNVIPNTEYRIVVLVPKYLPRQLITTIREAGSAFTIPRMYPLDPDSDGAFTLYDIFTMIRMPPRDILRLFITI